MLRALGLRQNVLRDHEREHRVDERHELHRCVDTSHSWKSMSG